MWLIFVLDIMVMRTQPTHLHIAVIFVEWKVSYINLLTRGCKVVKCYLSMCMEEPFVVNTYL